uniref:Transmembrane channel-like protein n=1 Tax=Cyprinus carpio TaxID=7962 RepID=A0A8C1W6Y4_CYPCA
MAASQVMETISSEDEDQEMIELEAIRSPYGAAKFDLTHANPEDLEAQHYHEPKHTNALHRNNWSSSTQRVLSSMPSCSIRFNQLTALSRSTVTCRRRPLSDVSTTNCTTEHDVFREQDDCENDVAQKEEVLNKLQGLSAGECMRVLREMPISVSEKRQIRAWVFCWAAGQPCVHRYKGASGSSAVCAFTMDQVEEAFNGRYREVNRETQQWYTYNHPVPEPRPGAVLCGWCYGRVSQQKSIQLWQGALRNISAHFGTGVLSYFIFLRRLLIYNILFFLINGLFLVLPQISNPPLPKNIHTTTADLWMLTGMGVLTDSVMFYGHYDNNISIYNNFKNVTKWCPENYNIPLAYIFTIGAGMFITCVMLVYSMSKSIGRGFRVFKTTGNLALKVFCSWDFKVSKKWSVKLQSVNICTQLKEMVSELSCRKQKRNLCSTLGWIHFLVWFICIFCIAACMLAVYHLPSYTDQICSKANSFQKAVCLLKLPLVMSCISQLLPGFFDMLSTVEHYDSPSTRIYVSIVRNLLLKGCIFGILCYCWFEQHSCRTKGLITWQCWETLVGQELYRLVLMDLLFAILYIIIAEFLWGLCIRNITFRRKKLEFDIARDVLELIYGQTLVWFGVLFSPLLPAVQIGKLFLLFYFKKTSLMTNFQPSKKTWRSTQMSTFFIKLLFFPSFTGALACVIYVMWRVGPSSDCGPFSNLHSMLLLGKECQGSSKPSMLWLSWTYKYLANNPIFLFITAGLFFTIIYIYMQVLDGQKMIIVRLQKQIENEGEDKKFLIAKIQALNEASAPQ